MHGCVQFCAPGLSPPHDSGLAGVLPLDTSGIVALPLSASWLLASSGFLPLCAVASLCSILSHKAVRNILQWIRALVFPHPLAPRCHLIHKLSPRQTQSATVTCMVPSVYARSHFIVYGIYAQEQIVMRNPMQKVFDRLHHRREKRPILRSLLMKIVLCIRATITR